MLKLPLCSLSIVCFLKCVLSPLCVKLSYTYSSSCGLIFITIQHYWSGNGLLCILAMCVREIPLAKWEGKHYMQCGCMMIIDESTAAGIGSNFVSH